MFGKRLHYLIKVLIFFSFTEKKTSSIKEISKRLDISEKVLEQVLLLLKNKDVLISKRGPGGGYKLSRNVSDMTIMDIIDLTGQKMRIFSKSDNIRERIIDKIIQNEWDNIEKEITLKLCTLRISDLVSNMREEIAGEELNYII